MILKSTWAHAFRKHRSFSRCFHENWDVVTQCQWQGKNHWILPWYLPSCSKKTITLSSSYMRVSYVSISSHILFMLPAAPTGIKSRGKKETCQVTLYDNSMMARVSTRKRKLNPVTFIHRSWNKNRNKHCCGKNQRCGND